MKYLNLGCGSRFNHDGWINVDFASANPDIITADLRKRIPFPDCTFDVVYHSHLLEHFTKKEGVIFCKECFRVLKQDGIIRIAVPDLEQIAKAYLKELDEAIKGDSSYSYPNYDWIMLELYDQTVREKSGGEMLEYFKQQPIPNEPFIYSRIGGEAKAIIQSLKANSSPNQNIITWNYKLISILKCVPRILYTACIRGILGKTNYQALKLGEFRQQGEIHQWMYDQYSLSQLLLQTGFQNPVKTNATESSINNWEKFNLDTDSDGNIYKPDSLYVEAFKSK